ncbi:MAG: hypothetical protein GY696_30460, partial [Gammaproteobacteria bacterium]|nr:hypothetical protein [Gammaproteobacteria bacterium]
MRDVRVGIWRKHWNLIPGIVEAYNRMLFGVKEKDEFDEAHSAIPQLPQDLLDANALMAAGGEPRFLLQQSGAGQDLDYSQFFNLEAVAAQDALLDRGDTGEPMVRETMFNVNFRNLDALRDSGDLNRHLAAIFDEVFAEAFKGEPESTRWSVAMDHNQWSRGGAGIGFGYADRFFGEIPLDICNNIKQSEPDFDILDNELTMSFTRIRDIGRGGAPPKPATHQGKLDALNPTVVYVPNNKDTLCLARSLVTALYYCIHKKTEGY